MRHLFFPDHQETSRIALLIKSSAFRKDEINRYYADVLIAQGWHPEDLVAFTVEYDSAGKAPVKFIKEYLDNLMPILGSMQVEYLYVADANYFKVLTNQKKADSHAGYVLPCAVKGFEHIKIVLGVNHSALIYNPDLKLKLEEGLNAITADATGNYISPGTGIIHQAIYPEGYQEIQEALNALHQYPTLACDIEAFSLRFWEAGIATIAFAPDQHRFVAFPCDYVPYPQLHGVVTEFQGKNEPNPVIRKMLKEFFISYKGELVFHNANYDVKVIVYTLFMESLLDTKGLLEGLEIMTRNFQDTKIITYLATNSTAGNVLGLKALAQEFAGNWAVDDIKDVRKVPLKELLQYNGVDCLCTNYVKNKYYPVMVADQQLDLYNNLMLPSARLIVQIELTGMPMSKKRITRVKRQLQVMAGKEMKIIRNHPMIQMMNLLVATKAMEAANAKLKTKQHPIDKFLGETFNPRSPNQLQKLLYDLMGLPVLDYTDKGAPATGGDTLEKLVNHASNEGFKQIIQALINFAQVDKILTTFIPAFERGIAKAKDGILWLHGNFNLGGTVSGRLSSSDPNLQNIPSGSVFGKLIKWIFMAPEGWLFCGADFNSLEDMISALTTKDPNKLKVYTDGFDGHSLRAAYYFKDELIAEGINIDITDPKSVNILKKMDHPLRRDSKAPTFLLTYGGTYFGMMSNLGWTKEKSQPIEANYHELYKVSDQYVQEKLQQASKDGYVTVAFDLRVRTPLLKQTIIGASRESYAAKAEGRTAGNAMGQSYGLLNNRAAVDFMRKVWTSKYRYDIKPVALIHDSIYLLMQDDIDIVEWVNRELILSMQWQELPELHHPIVKLGANLDIFWPDWSNPITLPNNASQEDIKQLTVKAIEEYGKKVQ